MTLSYCAQQNGNMYKQLAWENEWQRDVQHQTPLRKAGRLGLRLPAAPRPLTVVRMELPKMKEKPRKREAKPAHVFITSTLKMIR